MLKLKCIFLLGMITSALAKMEGFIVEGKFAFIENHAHSAFLSVNCKRRYGSSESYICGSSIINQQILLTAAHCLYECTYESHISVEIGSALLNNSVPYRTDMFIIHEEYDTRNSNNDIALVRVGRRFKLGKKVARVALMKNPPYNEEAIVAGWGMTDEIRGRYSNRLKFTTQKVWAKSRCLKLFRSLARGSMCAANDDIRNYASHGDSGSALVVRSYIQIGLVSYKIPTVSKHVVIYSDIGYYYDWITSYARTLPCIRMP